MPSIPVDERKHMLGPVNRCPRCHVARVRHYCRSCDQFYLTCGCSGTDQGDHLDHRVYLWTPSGVVALPDFDDR